MLVLEIKLESLGFCLHGLHVCFVYFCSDLSTSFMQGLEVPFVIVLLNSSSVMPFSISVSVHLVLFGEAMLSCVSPSTFVHPIDQVTPYLTTAASQ